jgi:5,10-methylene-tetrahydrofolate dehydrogenase/methenyl tetrahydrofolate cyclohydrolase
MNRVNRLSQHLTGSVDVDSLDPAFVESQARVMRALAASAVAGVFRDPREGQVKSLEASELFSVKGQVALVTGGSRGIGRMIAAGLAANGAKVYISSRKADVCDQV